MSRISSADRLELKMGLSSGLPYLCEAASTRVQCPRSSRPHARTKLEGFKAHGFTFPLSSVLSHHHPRGRAEESGPSR